MWNANSLVQFEPGSACTFPAMITLHHEHTHTHTHTHIYIYIYIYVCVCVWGGYTKELRYNETVCVWQYMLPYPCGVELSCEGSNGCHSRKARLFEWIELSVPVKQIYVNKTKVVHKVLKFLRLRWFLRGCAVESWVGVRVSWVSIPTSRISRLSLRWGVVIQRSSLSVVDYKYDRNMW